jgi:diaminohydroxyphosphoribosylaminopyrimidine deaminase/5-amino-6-(5-phosphoribosylamino)uracil reductase
MAWILSEIGKLGVHDLWIEAGGKLLTSLLANRQIHTLFWALAPRWIGAEGKPVFEITPEALLDAKCLGWSSLGSDVLGRFEW